MRPDGMRFSGRHRGWFHGTFGLLFLSGAGWWILHRFFPVHGEFGPRPHPWQPGLMMIHGGAAMLAILLVGTLVPLHMRRGWRARFNRRNGVLLISFVALLALSGYALYYAGGEGLRRFASQAHTLLGFLLPVVLAWHIVRGRRARRLAFMNSPGPLASSQITPSRDR